METMTKEQLDIKIKEIYENEKFKLDAYFFCGFPSGTPRETLIRACEGYLNSDSAEMRKHAAEALVAELEAALAATPKANGADQLVNNAEEIRTVLAHRDLLCASDCL